MGEGPEGDWSGDKEGGRLAHSLEKRLTWGVRALVRNDGTARAQEQIKRGCKAGTKTTKGENLRGEEPISAPWRTTRISSLPGGEERAGG